MSSRNRPGHGACTARPSNDDTDRTRPGSSDMNYFVTADTAERYARGRPYLHPEVVRRFMTMTGELPRALDVGCGTGMSSAPLVQLAGSVVGIDCSIDMLTHAQSGTGLHYAAATAELLPFQARTFDLVTVGLAFHWFERPLFLREARRVLTADGWLIVYNNWFKGLHQPNPSFDRWWKELYLRRYPTPARQLALPTEAEAKNTNFIPHSDAAFDSEIRMSNVEFIAYLTTQTNVVAVVQSGAESIQSVTDWLVESLGPVIPNEHSDFVFGHALSAFRCVAE